MKITIIYDNTVCKDGLQADWGFACLVEVYGKNILFDTGARGDILLENMKRLAIDPLKTDMVFISHDHWDHVDGLSAFLKIQNVKVLCPASCITGNGAGNIVKISDKTEIFTNVFSTGELDNIEQSLVIKKEDGLTVIAGCSHPGVEQILAKAAEFGTVKNLVGGLHGFNDFKVLEPLDKVCPTHCTQYINEIKELYPEKYIEGGAGKIISL